MAVDGSRKVRISVPEQYRNLDEGVWTDLESYLFRGFLVSPSYILGRNLVFKTLNHHELAYVRNFKPVRTSPIETESHYKSYFIAYSLFIVDGENVIHRRHDHVRRLVEIVSKMDQGVQKIVVENLAALNHRASRLHPLTEVYVHESRSRFRWFQLSGTQVHSPANTGIPGTDSLGMNHCQQAWTALNRMTDDREVMEQHWAHAKFVGSCWAGKGVRAVEERDRARKEKERSDLEDLKMKVLYRYLNRLSGEESPDESYRLPDGRMAKVVKRFRADDVEALRNQLEMAVNDEKDYHDLVVERKLREHQARAASLREARRGLFAAPAEEVGERVTVAGGSAGGSSVLSSKSEVDARLRRLKDLQRKQMSDYYQKAERESIRQAFDSDEEGRR